MKPVLSYLLIASASLAVVACSGGSGGGSSTGNSAHPGAKLTSPPTAPKGTLEGLAEIFSKTDTADVQGEIESTISDFKMAEINGSTSMNTQNCGDVQSGNWVNADDDLFIDNVHFVGKNCLMGSQDGISVYLSKEAKSSDSDNTKFWANAQSSTKTEVVFKKAGATVASEYTIHKAVLTANGKITVSAKEGGFSKLDNVVKPKYQAFWLDIQVAEDETAELTGYVQYYQEGKGLVTLSVVSTGYELDVITGCLINGQVTVKYADGSTAAGPRSKDICFQ